MSEPTKTSGRSVSVSLFGAVLSAISDHMALERGTEVMCETGPLNKLKDALGEMEAAATDMASADLEKALIRMKERALEQVESINYRLEEVRDKPPRQKPGPGLGR